MKYLKTFEYAKEWREDYLEQYPFAMRKKIKLAIELYEIVKLLDGEVILTDENFMVYNKNNKINRIYIKKNSGVYLWQEIYVEIITLKTNNVWEQDIVNILSSNKMEFIRDYLLDKFDFLRMQLDAKKYNL